MEIVELGSVAVDTKTTQQSGAADSEVQIKKFAAPL